MFTGIATYFSAEVARDQLKQSKETAEREVRSQARLVSLWVENNTRDDLVITVQNRSRDAISETEIRFFVQGSVGKKAIRAAFDIAANTMPPCSQLTLTSRSLWASVEGEPAKEQRYFIDDMSWYKSHGYGRLAYDSLWGLATVFWDRDGLTWTRGETLTQDGATNLPGGYSRGIYEGRLKTSHLDPGECTDGLT
ncbi:hypothetical protein ABZ608_26775 [Streptomyces sp. NPDC013172]|uniref:hypothetical protein n=1 Tax=Streptomyces sp. NPDC013172 TaxID=3155009 RepID=UPI0033D50C51